MTEIIFWSTFLSIIFQKVLSISYVDPDTPINYKSTNRYYDGAILHLVMSDEFNIDDRDFSPGSYVLDIYI